MTQEQMINAWKDVELRSSFAGNLNHPSGISLSELSIEEMQYIQGAGDVQPDAVTTPVCAVAAAALLATSLPCAAGAGVSAIATMLLSLEIC